MTTVEIERVKKDDLSTKNSEHQKKLDSVVADFNKLKTLAGQIGKPGLTDYEQAAMDGVQESNDGAETAIDSRESDRQNLVSTEQEKHANEMAVTETTLNGESDLIKSTLGSMETPEMDPGLSASANVADSTSKEVAGIKVEEKTNKQEGDNQANEKVTSIKSNRIQR